MSFFKRSVLALLFVFGAWDDIMPFAEEVVPPELRRSSGSADKSSSVPDPWSDDDAEDGFALRGAVQEAVLFLDSLIDAIQAPDGALFLEPTRTCKSDPFIRGILHVPIFAGSL